MKFKLDENIPTEVVEILQNEGFVAISVVEEKLSGEDDTIIASRVKAEGMCLITLDLDFSDVRLYPPKEYAGIAVLRPHRQDKISIMELVTALLGCIKTGEHLEHHLWIIEPERIRIHEPED